MPPEQISSRPGTIDGRADVYAIGAILYQLATGELPFTATRTFEILEKVMYEAPAPLREKNPAVSEALEAICLRALEKDPKDRYPSAGYLAVDIERLLGGSKIDTPRKTRGWKRISSWLRSP